MITAFGQGALAGLAVALPIGAIATLIVLWAARYGWRVGAAAGLGAAAVDGIYATLALLVGAALSPVIESWREPLRWGSAVVLVVMGGLMIASGWRTRSGGEQPERKLRPLAAFGTVFGLTVVNPTTVVYFTALVAGGGLTATAPVDQAAFAVGAMLASAGWQLTLATLGVIAGTWVTGPRGRRWAAFAGGAIVIGLALWTLFH